MNRDEDIHSGFINKNENLLKLDAVFWLLLKKLGPKKNSKRNKLEHFLAARIFFNAAGNGCDPEFGEPSTYTITITLVRPEGIQKPQSMITNHLPNHQYTKSVYLTIMACTDTHGDTLYLRLTNTFVFWLVKQCILSSLNTDESTLILKRCTF